MAPMCSFRSAECCAGCDSYYRGAAAVTPAAASILSLLIVLMFAFTLEPRRLASPEFAAGLLWTTLLFAGTLSLNRSFLIERESGAWTALALCIGSKYEIGQV